MFLFRKTSSSAWSGSSRERDLLIMPKIIVIIDRPLSYAYTLIGNYVLLTSVKTGCQCCLKIDVRYRVHIVGQRANRYIVAFYVAIIVIMYDIYCVGPAASGK